jgi:hypothetical protein
MGNSCKGSNRVLRGGSWNNTAANCRVANRNNNTPDNRNNNNGFRVVSPELKRMDGFPLLNRLLHHSLYGKIINYKDSISKIFIFESSVFLFLNKF